MTSYIVVTPAQYHEHLANLPSRKLMAVLDALTQKPIRNDWVGYCVVHPQHNLIHTFYYDLCRRTGDMLQSQTRQSLDGKFKTEFRKAKARQRKLNLRYKP